MKKRALITGISSQDGAYLSKLLLKENYEVIGLVRSVQSKPLPNLNYVGVSDSVLIECTDLLDVSDLSILFKKYKFDEIYNLSAQSSVGLSFANPLPTIKYNSISVINLLESIRLLQPKAKFLQPVSSEMYGSNLKLPINEDSIIKPNSPYAISKSLAYWSVKNYRNSYDIFACNSILFNHESHLRSNNFFVKKIICSAFDIKEGKKTELRVGNIDIKRDFGFAPDYVRAMWMILQGKIADDYVVCSGTSIKLRDVVEYVFNYLEIDLKKIIVDPKFFRPAEIIDMYGDSRKIKSQLGWNYDKSFFDILRILIEEEKMSRNIKNKEIK